MVALTDFLSAPKVLSIETLDYHGALGDPILANAIDDFMLTKVKVVITNAAFTLPSGPWPDSRILSVWFAR
jgi:hypothetical protein